ncbi:MAG: 4Fe-4S binding protein [Eubacteriales bacterium]|nr:4Fe-4S binding protein [Eubacteriales bacterium]
MVRRRIVQALSAVLYNANFKGFFEGRIYQGGLKNICVPGLNCYSCPGALGSCPIGSFQAAIGAVYYKVSLYVTGFLILVGALFGRFICGWVCPFGLIQELIYKIPSRKLRHARAFRPLKYLKYAVLAVFVFLIPLILYLQSGLAEPAFCKYICPAGTLEAGIPLVLLNESLQSSIGWLFSWKVLLLIVTVVSAVFIYRPFCRFVCPLGAVYALFNKISVFGLRIQHAKCTGCGACAAACKMEIDPSVTPNSAECIRCGDCVKACATSALKFGAVRKREEEKIEEI